MNYLNRYKGVTALLMGILLVLSIVLIAASQNNALVGRYRMTVVTRGNFTDIYIIDTATGVVKYAGKDEGKPFEAISGK